MVEDGLKDFEKFVENEEKKFEGEVKKVEV